MTDTILQHGAAAPTSLPATALAQSKREKAMPVVAFDGLRAPARRAVTFLTEREKAMLFDMALDARAEVAYAEVAAAAPLIEAFARAYVALRDREEGIV